MLIENQAPFLKSNRPLSTFTYPHIVHMGAFSRTNRFIYRQFTIFRFRNFTIFYS